MLHEKLKKCPAAIARVTYLEGQLTERHDRSRVEQMQTSQWPSEILVSACRLTQSCCQACQTLMVFHHVKLSQQHANLQVSYIPSSPWEILRPLQTILIILYCHKQHIAKYLLQKPVGDRFAHLGDCRRHRCFRVMRRPYTSTYLIHLGLPLQTSLLLC